jgi:hypothetical protein
VAAIADWSDFGEDWAGEMVTQLQGAREGWEENADEERMDDGDGAAAAAAAAGKAARGRAAHGSAAAAAAQVRTRLRRGVKAVRGFRVGIERY